MTASPRCRILVVALSFAAAPFAVPTAARQQSAPTPAAAAAPSTVPAWAFPIPPSRGGGRGPAAGSAAGAASGPAAGAPAGAAGAQTPGPAAAQGAPAPARGRGAVDPTPRSVPNSPRQYTAAQTRDSFSIADWHPDEHPPLPDVVEHGRRPEVRACGYCHLANGFGKPENAPLAGQPAEYLIQQMHDFRDGKRLGSEPRVVGPALMVTISKAATEEEIHTAAEYFASVKRKPWIKVIEADMVPVTRNTGVMYAVVEGAGTEPVGNRIVEVSTNYEATELRDGGTPFLAYVPTGAVKKGEALVKTGGNGKTVACGICHGANMKGVGVVPSIAGRSPSYMGRQLYDFKSGSRHGTNSALMQPVVANLTDEDIVDMLAYLATLEP
ncbi:MAG: c-type cytochrome [Acidobacteria bacterium]|nr:c-type cytochrome [Acidobacteriota bacterium]